MVFSKFHGHPLFFQTFKQIYKMPTQKHMLMQTANENIVPTPTPAIILMNDRYLLRDT